MAGSEPSPKFQVTVGVSPSASVTVAVKVTIWYFTGAPEGMLWARLMTGALLGSTAMVRSAIFLPLARPSSTVRVTM